MTPLLVNLNLSLTLTYPFKIDYDVAEAGKRLERLSEAAKVRCF